jgi:hypothetical protein
MSRVMAEELDGLRNRIAALEPLEQPLPSAVAPFLLLPGLRGFWPMSAFDSSGNAQDQSGHAHHLTYNGNPTYNYTGLAPHIMLDGVGGYLSRADEADLDITGTEAYVAAAARGLTVGGWFYHQNAAGTEEQIIAKYAAAGDQRSWQMRRWTTGAAQVLISSDGTAGTLLTAGGATLAASTWYHIVARFVPSTSLAICVNGVWSSVVVAVPASIHSGTAALNVGFSLPGRASLCFLCAAALSDTQIASIFNATRALFGV